MLGEPKRRVLLERVRGIVDDADEFVRNVLATYEDNRHVERFECRILAGEGREQRWLEHWTQPIRSGLYAGGRIEHYYDITERKRAEEERARMAAIVRSTDDAILGIGLDGLNHQLAIREAGRVVGISSIVRDISERKRAEREREALHEQEREARARAEAAVRARDEVLARPGAQNGVRRARRPREVFREP